MRICTATLALTIGAHSHSKRAGMVLDSKFLRLAEVLK